MRFRCEPKPTRCALRDAIAAADALVVIGGGATGVQLAGAAAHTHPDLTITLVDGGDNLLAGMGGSTSRGAERILRDRGVELVLGDEVDSIDESGAQVGDRHIDGVVVWAAGFQARADHFDIPCDDQGRILVDEHLQVPGWSTTFAAGDIALHPGTDGEPLPMSAQIAVKAGESAGSNAAALVQGEPMESAELSHLGWVLDLGGHRGLAQLGPVALTAPGLDLVPPLLHWGIDVKHLVDTRRRFRPRRPPGLNPTPREVRSVLPAPDRAAGARVGRCCRSAPSSESARGLDETRVGGLRRVVSTRGHSRPSSATPAASWSTSWSSSSSTTTSTSVPVNSNGPRCRPVRS